MTTLASLALYAQLAQAAYLHEDNKPENNTLLDWLKNSEQTKFSDAQAAAFTARYELVNQQPNDDTGFSASVFREKATGRLILSCRGTEPYEQGGLDLLADVIQVANPFVGCAVDQIVSLYNYISRLNAAEDTQVVQYRAIWNLEEITLPSGEVQVSKVFAGCEVLQEPAAGLGVFRSDDGTLQQFDITGHSLGGELAHAAARLFASQMGECVTFNAAGFIMSSGTPDQLFAALAGAGTSFPAGSMTNAYAEEGLEATTSDLYFTQFGTRVAYAIEQSGNPVDWHGMDASADALAVMSLLDGLPLAEANEVFRTLTINPVGRIDALLGLICRATGIAPSSSEDDREFIYETVARLQGVSATNVTSLRGRSAAELELLAAQSDAVRRALLAGSPLAFDFPGAGASFPDFSESRYEAYSPEHWADRAVMLEWKMKVAADGADASNIASPYVADGVPSIAFRDLQYGEALYLGLPELGQPNRRTQVVFGSAFDDTVEGGLKADHLYGGGGADTMRGNAGEDRLEGGDGNDILDGGAGRDKLIGGAGNDWLGFRAAGLGNESLDEMNSVGNEYDGGTGNDRISGSKQLDTYLFRKGDGHDFIQTQGGGDELRLLPNGSLETGFDIVEADVTFIKSGLDLEVHVGAGTDVVTIFGWFDPQTTAKRLGTVTLGSKVWTEPEITALAEAATPVTEVIGTEGADTLYGLSNVSSVVRGLGGADTLYGSRKTDYLFGDGGNDRLFGGDGGDVLDGGAGDDILNGDGGDDFLNGGDGNDTLNGGMGSDILRGGAGDDILGTRAKEDTGYWSNGTYISPGGGNVYEGGPGRDTLNGTSLADLYLFNLGDGHDTIRETPVQGQPVGEVDVLRFGEDILPSDIRVERSDTNLVLRHVNGTDSVTVQAWFENSTVGPNMLRVERVEFADGTVWLADDLTAQGLVVEGTEGGDTLAGLADCVNTLYGRGGADTLKGGNLADELYGGTGNDNLQGGLGQDIYHYLYGDGMDTVTDTGGEDTLRFHDIESSIAQFFRQGHDLVVEIGGVTPGSVTVKNHFYNTASQVETFDFADRSYSVAEVQSLAILKL